MEKIILAVAILQKMWNIQKITYKIYRYNLQYHVISWEPGGNKFHRLMGTWGKFLKTTKC